VPAVEVLVLYGTEYGFAREIAAKVAAALRAKRIRAVIKDMAEVPSGIPLASNTDGAPQAALFICSTHGDGVPPPEARDFFDWLASGAAPKLAGLPFSVCALGDTSYTHFCKAGRAVDARLLALRGDATAPRADINREDWAAVDAWIAAAVDSLVARKLSPRAPRAASGASSAGAPAAVLPHGKARPFGATLVAKQGLCVLDGPDDKDTVRLEFDIRGSGLDYLPGDALGVFSTNNAPEVARLLSALGAHGNEVVPAPAWRLPGAAPTLPLHDALAVYYDMRDPRPTLLAWLAERAAQADERALLMSLLKDGTDAGRNKPLAAFLAQRHVSDVLAAAPSAPVTWQDVLPHLRQLQPRLYSISSSPVRESVFPLSPCDSDARFCSLSTPVT
jgi:sulfite reductase (NADPH) flavoprotein alpha-component